MCVLTHDSYDQIINGGIVDTQCCVLWNCVGSRVMFVLQIGSWNQTPTCNVRLEGDRALGQVLLQYTRNKVITDYYVVFFAVCSFFA